MKDVMLAACATSFGFMVVSYAKAKTHDFGRVPEHLHAYLLAFAALAFACLWALIARAYLQHSDALRLRVAVYASSYFALQIGFVPLVRYASGAGRTGRTAVRAFLLASVVPVALLFASMVARAGASDVALSGIVVFHTLVNDAIVYGGLF